MVAPSSPLSFSQVAARGRGTLYVRSTLKTGARSLSFATSNNNTTAGGLSVGSPVRAVASPHLIAIVGGAVCAAVALAVVLAVVHVLRVKRKVEHFGRLINVLGPGTNAQHPSFFDCVCADAHLLQNSSCQCRCRCRLYGFPTK